MKNFKQAYRYIIQIIPIIIIILEALPYGAICIFAPNPTERVRKMFSYFNLIPFGYANFAPLITAVLTCILLVVVLIASYKNDSINMTNVFILSFVTTIISLLPITLGFEYYSTIGIIITICLAIETIILKVVKFN